MTIILRTTILMGALAVVAVATCPAQQPITARQPHPSVHTGNMTGRYEDGKDGFPRYCNGCHGVRGDGNGTLAPYLDPRPRDYTMGIFKCRSTPTGTLPTDDDLYETLGRGIVTTAMPPWAPLPPQTRMDIVVYLKGFSPRFAHEKPGIPIPIPAESEITLASIKRGAQVYSKLQCASCHGAAGHGDGPQAATLIDIKHRPLPPYDFTATERFKCGTTNRELYRTLMTGMDGGPMLSYADKLTPEQAWDLVHYLRTLQTAVKSKERGLSESAGGVKALAVEQP